MNHRFIGVLLLFSLVAAACTTNSDNNAEAVPTTTGSVETTAPADTAGNSQATDAPATTAGPIELTASWTGVTEDSITLGFTDVDVARLNDEFSVEVSRAPAGAIIAAQVDALNAEGGINGRQVNFVQELFVPVGADDSIRACEVLTAEAQAFLVIGNLLNDNPLCITEIHETPYLGLFGLTDERQERSRAPFVSIAMAADKQRLNSIKVLLAEGDLDGKRVALDWAAADRRVVEEVILPMLEEAGVDLVATTEREDAAGDTAAIEQINSNAIQQWVAGDAQIVIEVSGVVEITLGIQANNYAPEQLIYLNGQARGAALFEGTGVDLAALDFATAVVPARPPIGPFFADPDLIQCLDNYYAANPDAELLTADTVPDQYENIGRACASFELFRLAAERAGGNLTPDTWVAAVESLGDVDLPGIPGLSYRPGKRDGGNAMSRYVFDVDAGRLLPTGDPIFVE